MNLEELILATGGTVAIIVIIITIMEIIEYA